MPRTDIPRAQWETLKTDPIGYKVRYTFPGVMLGEPAFYKGEEPADDYASCNHIMFDDGRVNSMQIRKQGQNPIEIAIGDETPPKWTKLSEIPYYGPDPHYKFPPESFWSSWNSTLPDQPAEEPEG